MILYNKIVLFESIINEIPNILGNFTVKVVNGKEIRDNNNSEFIGGGHGYIYSYVPKTEIWIEELIDKTEMNKILAHEMVEILLMRDKSWKYLKAHDIANYVEDKLRNGEKPEKVFREYQEKYFPNNKEYTTLLTRSYKIKF